MKKIFAVMLLVAMMFTATSADAVEIPETDNSAKIADSLKLKLGELSEDDIVSVWVWFAHGLSGSEIDRLTIEKHGPEIAQLEGGNEREKVNRWRRARNEIITEFYVANNERILEDLGIEDYERDFVSMMTPSAILYVPCSKVLSMIEHPEVSGVDYYEEAVLDSPEEDIPDPPVEDLPDSPEEEGTEIEIPSTEPIEEENYYTKDEFLEKFWSFCTDIEEYSTGMVEIWDAKVIGDILIFTGDCAGTEQDPMESYSEILGDWVVSNSGYYTYGQGLCLYAYDGEKFYTIKEAWDSGIVTDLSEVEDFSEPIYVTKIGDVNRDKKIDIKDATSIQKHLADLTTLVVENGFGYIYDYTKDSEINIKDVTATQKHIAGLE